MSIKTTWTVFTIGTSQRGDSLFRDFVIFTESLSFCAEKASCLMETVRQGDRRNNTRKAVGDKRLLALSLQDTWSDSWTTLYA